MQIIQLSTRKKQALALSILVTVIALTFFATKAWAMGDDNAAASHAKPSVYEEYKIIKLAPSTTTTTLATTTTTLPPSTTIATTTTTIRPVATTTPVASSENLCSLVDNYDWPTGVAYRVCMQESGGNSNAANWTDPHPELGCSGSFGLMQMNCGYGQLFDPKTNMDAAHTMWNKYGWKPWAGTCRKVGC